MQAGVRVKRTSDRRIHNYSRIQVADPPFDIVAAGFGVRQAAAFADLALPDAAAVEWKVLYCDGSVRRPVVRSGWVMFGKGRLVVRVLEQRADHAHLFLGK